MTIVFTLHALERMKTRGVDRSEVVLCVTNPDRVEKLNETFRAVKKADNKILIVIYRTENTNMVAVTAYRSSRVHKYLG
ncbi:MAG: DUF4258 domain-containing protein [Thermoproteota archaeon]